MMKSLDFLEKLEKDYHNNIIGLYYRTSISKEYRDKLYDKYNKDFEKIKQDLEVLEILRKYIPKNWSGYQIVCSGKANSSEDWEKLKQWLEVNENE